MGEGAPGEDGSGDPVFTAAGVFVNGGLQLGENFDEFALMGRGYTTTEFPDAIFNTSSGRHTTSSRRGVPVNIAESAGICDTGAGVGGIGEHLRAMADDFGGFVRLRPLLGRGRPCRHFSGIYSYVWFP